MTPARRRYIYGIATAGMPLLIAVGYVTENLAPIVLGVIASVLVPDLARRNVADDDAR